MPSDEKKKSKKSRREREPTPEREEEVDYTEDNAEETTNNETIEDRAGQAQEQSDQEIGTVETQPNGGTSVPINTPGEESDQLIPPPTGSALRGSAFETPKRSPTQSVGETGTLPVMMNMPTMLVGSGNPVLSLPSAETMQYMCSWWAMMMAQQQMASAAGLPLFPSGIINPPAVFPRPTPAPAAANPPHPAVSTSARETMVEQQLPPLPGNLSISSEGATTDKGSLHTDDLVGAGDTVVGTHRAPVDGRSLLESTVHVVRTSQQDYLDDFCRDHGKLLTVNQLRTADSGNPADEAIVMNYISQFNNFLVQRHISDTEKAPPVKVIFDEEAVNYLNTLFGNEEWQSDKPVMLARRLRARMLPPGAKPTDLREEVLKSMAQIQKPWVDAHLIRGQMIAYIGHCTTVLFSYGIALPESIDKLTRKRFLDLFKRFRTKKGNKKPSEIRRWIEEWTNEHNLQTLSWGDLFNTILKRCEERKVRAQLAKANGQFIEDAAATSDEEDSGHESQSKAPFQSNGKKRNRQQERVDRETASAADHPPKRVLDSSNVTDAVSTTPGRQRRASFGIIRIGIGIQLDGASQDQAKSSKKDLIRRNCRTTMIGTAMC